jgi:prepilin-type N-terminal cleavage/methylation domain-containing protein
LECGDLSPLLWTPQSGDNSAFLGPHNKSGDKSPHSKKRAGVTLIEVLITIFIMAIGMLALLTLFPVGAISMGRALIYDRAQQAAANAEAIALSQDIRHDPIVTSDTGVAPPPAVIVADAFQNPFGTVLTNTSGISYGVFVDCWGYLSDPTETIGALAGVSQGMRRRSISLQNSATHNVPSLTWLKLPEAGRWCSLTDDLYWSIPNNGTSDLSTGTPRRGLTYTWSWLLRRPRAFDTEVVDMSIVIYRNHDVSLGISGETTYAATGTAGTNSVTITYPAGSPPRMRVGRWILDTSPVGAITTTAVPGYFYRVVDYAPGAAANTLQLELESNLKQNVSAAVVMEDVVEVIDKGSGWKP